MATIQEDQRTKTVSQGAIDAIKQMGMSAALKKYTAGEGGPEFKTAMERYYSPQRLTAASKAATQGMVAKPGTPAAAPSAPSKPVPMPASAQAAATRKSNPNAKVLGIFPKDYAHSPLGKLLSGGKGGGMLTNFPNLPAGQGGFPAGATSTSPAPKPKSAPAPKTPFKSMMGPF